MPKIDYKQSNFNRCLCGGCPVNRSSACVANQEKNLENQGAIDAIQKESKMPEPDQMPGIYCAIGKSKCADMGKKKVCLCPACSVAINAPLRNNYFCLRGSAEEIE